jgi:hypothetical protein
MDDKRRGNLSLLLSLASLAASASFFVLFINALLEAGFPFSEVEFMPSEKMWSFSGRLFLMGWLPGLVLAVVSLMILRRSQGLHRIIPACIFSALTIIASVIWALSAFMWLIQALPG